VQNLATNINATFIVKMVGFAAPQIFVIFIHLYFVSKLWSKLIYKIDPRPPRSQPLRPRPRSCRRTRSTWPRRSWKISTWRIPSAGACCHGATFECRKSKCRKDSDNVEFIWPLLTAPAGVRCPPRWLLGWNMYLTRSQSYDHELKASGTKNYYPTSSLVRFENKNIFIYLEKML
jgi:hypothetical protein